MRLTILAAVCGLAVSAVPAVSQQGPTDYLDITKVKIRPEKVTEYDSLIKKLADINRRHKGDNWIAFSTEYGPDTGTLYFSSPRENLAGIETGFGRFEKAITTALGPGGFGKTMNDLNGGAASVVGEIRRRRWDLSVNAPSSQAEQFRILAATRWIRSVKTVFKPGRSVDFLDAWQAWQAELARMEPKVSLWVSTSMTGQSTFYVASFFKSMAEMDAMDAQMQKATTTDAYRKLMGAVKDTAESSVWEIHRLRPELSSMPDEFVALDPGFWKPKPRPAAAPKPAERK